MTSAEQAGGPPVGDDGKTWEERRRKAPTVLELYQNNAAALESGGVRACQMRYSLVGEQISFYFRFEDEMPSRLGFEFPMTYPENLRAEGWKKFHLTLDVLAEGQLFVQMRGRYERDGVPLDVVTRFIRIVGKGVGIADDWVSYTDARNREAGETSMAAILDDKFKDGTPKFTRKGDSIRDLSVEGHVAILTRYLKNAALRRRAIKV